MTKKHTYSSFHISAMFLCGVILYFYQFVLRSSPNVLLDELMAAFQIKAGSVSSLVSYYYHAYAALQIVVGLLVDKFGPRLILSITAILCGIGAALFGYTESYFMAAVGRFIIGAGAASVVTGTLKIVSMWLPNQKMAFYTGLLLAVGTFGAISAGAPLAVMVDYLGWRTSMIIIGFIGLGISLLISLVVRNNPKTLLQQSDSDSEGAIVHLFKSLKEVLVNKEIWKIGLFGFFIYAPLAVFADILGTPFLSKSYDLPCAQAAAIASTMYLGVMIGAPCMSFIYNWIGSAGKLLRYSCSVALLAMIIVVFVPNIPVFLMSALLFLVGFACSSLILIFVLANFVTPLSLRATAYSTVNMIQMVSGVLLQPLCGHLVDLFWDGALKNNLPIYSVSCYKIALMPAVVSMAGAIVITYFLKEGKEETV